MQEITDRIRDIDSRLQAVKKGSQEEEQAVRAWMDLQDDIEAALRGAMKRGIEGGEEEARRWDAGSVTPLERYGIEAIVDYTVDLFRGRDYERIDFGSLLYLVEGFTRTLAADPILRKVLGAWSMEYTLSDTPITDGLLGRAVDAVVNQIAPYTRARSPVWWEKVMETQR